MKLKYPQKSTKTGKEFRGGGRIFLAGQNIYPCNKERFKKIRQRSRKEKEGNGTRKLELNIQPYF